MDEFKSQSNGVVSIITCPEQINFRTIGDLNAQKLKWINSGAVLHIFNFKSVRDLSSDCYRDFGLFSKEAKAKTQTIASLNVSLKLRSQMSRDGVDGFFNPVRDIPDALRKAAISVPEKDVAQPNVLVEAMKKVMELWRNSGAPDVKLLSQKEKAEDSIYPPGFAGGFNVPSPKFNGVFTTYWSRELVESLRTDKSEELADFFETFIEKTHEVFQAVIQASSSTQIPMAFARIYESEEPISSPRQTNRTFIFEVSIKGRTCFIELELE